VSSSYNILDECVECARLLSGYEAITFEQARVLNALESAEAIGDRMAIRRRKLEACEVTARQRAAREDLRRHRDSDHAIPRAVKTESAAPATRIVEARAIVTQRTNNLESNSLAESYSNRGARV